MNAGEIVSVAKQGDKQSFNQFIKSLEEDRDDIVLEAAFIDYCEADGKRLIHHIAAHGCIEWFSFILEFSEEQDRIEELVESETSDNKTIAHFIVCVFSSI